MFRLLFTYHLIFSTTHFTQICLPVQHIQSHSVSIYLGLPRLALRTSLSNDFASVISLALSGTHIFQYFRLTRTYSSSHSLCFLTPAIILSSTYVSRTLISNCKTCIMKNIRNLLFKIVFFSLLCIGLIHLPLLLSYSFSLESF